MSEVRIGVIGRPHGVHGAVKIRSYSGEVDHFRSLREVDVELEGRRRPYRIRDVRIQGMTPVITFEGVATPEAARLLTGGELWVPEDSAAPLGEGEFYLRDLVGCTVASRSAVFGVVVGVIDAAQAPLLEVELTDGTVRMVPFMRVYVGDVDIGSRRIELETPWILDIE
jgi:16S rRNA processing protein RimM